MIFFSALLVDKESLIAVINESLGPSLEVLGDEGQEVPDDKLDGDDDGGAESEESGAAQGEQRHPFRQPGRFRREVSVANLFPHAGQDDCRENGWNMRKK